MRVRQERAAAAAAVANAQKVHKILLDKRSVERQTCACVAAIAARDSRRARHSLVRSPARPRNRPPSRSRSSISCIWRFFVHMRVFERASTRARVVAVPRLIRRAFEQRQRACKRRFVCLLIDCQDEKSVPLFYLTKTKNCTNRKL